MKENKFEKVKTMSFQELEKFASILPNDEWMFKSWIKGYLQQKGYLSKEPNLFNYMDM